MITPMSESESSLEDESAEGSSLFGPAGSGLRWTAGTVVGGCLTLVGWLRNWLLQDGQQDLLTATITSVGLLGPVWMLLGGMELIGVSKNVLCSSKEMSVLAVPIAGLVELLVFMFILKGLLRLMIATSRGEEPVDPLLSIVAAIIPLVLGSFFEIGNDTLLNCLYP